MLSFEWTEDLDLVRQILTEPRCWRRMAGDHDPGPSTFEVVPRAGLDYVVARDSGRAAAAFVIVDRGELAAEVHLCFQPQFWGRAVEIFRAFLNWIWSATGFCCLIGPVFEYSRLAVRLASLTGFIEVGREPDAVMKHGRLYDRILMQLERPR